MSECQPSKKVNGGIDLEAVYYHSFEPADLIFVLHSLNLLLPKLLLEECERAAALCPFVCASACDWGK